MRCPLIPRRAPPPNTPCVCSVSVIFVVAFAQARCRPDKIKSKNRRHATDVFQWRFYRRVQALGRIYPDPTSLKRVWIGRAYDSTTAHRTPSISLRRPGRRPGDRRRGCLTRHVPSLESFCPQTKASGRCIETRPMRGSIECYRQEGSDSDQAGRWISLSVSCGERLGCSFSPAAGGSLRGTPSSDSGPFMGLD